jgi:ATP-dependent Clp protease ATP-binding subunit ClpA
MFNRLKREHMGGILDIRLQEVGKRLAAHKITIDVSAEAKEWLCDAGFNPSYGARPLNRVVKTHVLDPLSRAILSGAVKDEEIARIELRDDRIVLVDNHIVDGEQPSSSYIDDEDES